MWMIFLMQSQTLPVCAGLQYLIFMGQIVEQDQVDTTQADWVKPDGCVVVLLLESEFWGFARCDLPDKVKIPKAD